MGLDVSGPLGRGADASGADVVLLCVPDSAIADAASKLVLSEGALVGHCSGATSLAVLEPHEGFSLHPLTTIADSSASLAGVTCAVAGASERATSVATALALALGMHPVRVAEADRVIYHAAATLASNYLVTLEGAAERLFALAGLTRDDAAPLVNAAIESWTRLGAHDALTGPIARGDEQTVLRQREAVAERAPELLELWDALTAATRALAEQIPPGAPAGAPNR